MSYRRILTIQDISCVGQCSLTVALPIISACGIETCIMPSAVLSTHTGEFKGFTFRDLTDDMEAISKHWEKANIEFDGFYIGYLGSVKQIEIVRDVIRRNAKDEYVVIVDPAMADNGSLYVGFDNDFVRKLKVLCNEADYLLPNITEACLLTDTPYRELFDKAYVEELLNKLALLGPKKIIMTGVSFDDKTTGVATYHEGKTTYYMHRKIQMRCHGTGDVFASAFTGALFNGITAEKSAGIAADYVLKCIENTATDKSHWYGVKFETAISDLIAMIKHNREQTENEW